MSTSEVDTIIAEIQHLAQRLDNLPDVSDAQMALMYLRRLRRKHATGR